MKSPTIVTGQQPILRPREIGQTEAQQVQSKELPPDEHAPLIAPLGEVGPAASSGAASLQSLIDARRAKDGALVIGDAERSVEWAKLNLVAAEALAFFEGHPRSLTAAMITQGAVDAASGRGLNLDRTQVKALLDRWSTAGVLKKTGEGYTLAVPYEEALVEAGAVGLIHRSLTHDLSVLAMTKSGPAQVRRRRALLDRVSSLSLATEAFPRFPVEARWPVLKAVGLLPRLEQARLQEALKSDPALASLPLVDAIGLMLSLQAPAGWIDRFAPQLKGATVYSIAAEGPSYKVGGLGRVQQYHTKGMKKLVGDQASVVAIEPFYSSRINLKGELEPVDYRKRSAVVSTPVSDLSERPVFEFEVTVDGKKVPAQVYRGVNEDGVEAYLIKDPADRLTKICYGYDKHGNGSWEEFSEFFSRASLELIKRLEREKQQTRSEAYRPPAIIANDGQCAPFPFYKAELDEFKDGSGKEDPTLRRAAVLMTTHTHGNRQTYDQEGGKWALRKLGVPERMWRYAWRIDKDDITSLGVRMALLASGVSAVHVDRVSPIDPQKRMVAVTNGDERSASSGPLRAILRQANPAVDVEDPKPAELKAAKRVAKQRLGEELIKLGLVDSFDPDRMVISYSGRLVPEKAGRDRAFQEKNLRRLIERGVNVVLYGNVQPNAESERLYRELVALAAEINASAKGQPGAGRLVVRTGWGPIPDQVNLLAATDLQMQDSNYSTGAAEASESDAPANGALVSGPPWLEGIIQRQGELIDFAQPGSGNLLIPKDESPEAYFAMFSRAADEFQQHPERFAEHQVASIKISRALESLMTSAEYLRQLNGMLERIPT